MWAVGAGMLRDVFFDTGDGAPPVSVPTQRLGEMVPRALAAWRGTSLRSRARIALHAASSYALLLLAAAREVASLARASILLVLVLPLCLSVLCSRLGAVRDL